MPDLGRSCERSGAAQAPRFTRSGRVTSHWYVLCLSVGDNFYLYSVITPLPDLTRHAILTQTLTHRLSQTYVLLYSNIYPRSRRPLRRTGRRETTYVTPRMCADISVVSGSRAFSGSIRAQRQDLRGFLRGLSPTLWPSTSARSSCAVISNASRSHSPRGWTLRKNKHSLLFFTSRASSSLPISSLPWPARYSHCRHFGSESCSSAMM
jgi:hypothetical protein